MIDWYLPGTKAGGPVRSVFSLCELMKPAFDICIFTTNRDLGSHEEYKDVPSDIFYEKDGLHYFYFSPQLTNKQSILRTLKEWKPDVIYLNSFWSYFFSICVVREKKKLKTKIILAPRGMLSGGAMSLKPFKKKCFLFLAKISGTYRGVFFHATNEKEKIDILHQFPNVQAKVLSNISSGTLIQLPKEKRKGELRLFYLSRIARVKNLHYALQVLQSVPSNIHVTYDIFGNNEDKEYWQECENMLPLLPANVHVHFKGELAFHEVQKNICAYHALFLPSLSENYGHSIAESLLSGCAVIISDQTPWREDGQSKAVFAFPLAQAEKFGEAIIQLAHCDPDEFEGVTKAAIDYISSKMNLVKSKADYAALFYG